jgi:hypothetical protein
LGAKKNLEPPRLSIKRLFGNGLGVRQLHAVDARQNISVRFIDLKSVLVRL